MNLLSKKILVSKTARYFLSGEPSANLESVWFVCHGYGQIANIFLEKFKSIHSSKVLIIAPEGFHRFYKKGFFGDVVASWMTKEERLGDIQDYVNFLDRVYEEVIEKTGKIKINVLGFSQGTSTVCRWLCQGKAKADKLVLWGGGVPPDIDFKTAGPVLNKLNLNIVIGNADEFITREQQEEHLEILKQNNIRFEFISYEGKHDIEEKVLMSVCEKQI